MVTGSEQESKESSGPIGDSENGSYRNSSSRGTSSLSTSYMAIQVNNIDCYQKAPSSLDMDKYTDMRSDITLPQVPVIRIFGTTSTGYNTLVHVHGVFPYFYIRYKGGTNPEQGEYR
ncbi:Rev3p [Sugiyamaella lignohabitans]|uniref:Rev3p n=1 Tax=Sugiyamaella lignohabitans TaxID=796027 RepID=A0A161HIB3_9ASCO|nr:Rev3p [Sugiyamaella lignohabitans]ANB12187.1 Rev3p [Sugiyamaella lignohabitans]